MKNSKMIEACLACFAACEATATESIRKVDADYQRCIALCLDCIEMCILCVKLDQRNSMFSHPLMKVCVESCIACAEECERFPDQAYHVASAKACRTCAEEMSVHLDT